MVQNDMPLIEGHFGPYLMITHQNRWLWQMSGSLWLPIHLSSNHSSTSLGFQYNDVTSLGIKQVLATSAGHMAVMTSRLDFQHGAFY